MSSLFSRDVEFGKCDKNRIRRSESICNRLLRRPSGFLVPASGAMLWIRYEDCGSTRYRLKYLFYHAAQPQLYEIGDIDPIVP